MFALTPQKAIATLREKLQIHVPEAGWKQVTTREESWLNIPDRARIVVARSVAGGVEIGIRDTGERRDRTLGFGVRRNQDIDRIFSEIAQRAVWWAGRLTVWRLQPDRAYAVVREFADHQGRRFQAGQRLTFVKHELARYDGYDVLTFREEVMTLEEEGPLQVNLDAYLEEG